MANLELVDREGRAQSERPEAQLARLLLARRRDLSSDDDAANGAPGAGGSLAGSPEPGGAQVPPARRAAAAAATSALPPRRRRRRGGARQRVGAAPGRSARAAERRRKGASSAPTASAGWRSWAPWSCAERAGSRRAVSRASCLFVWPVYVRVAASDVRVVVRGYYAGASAPTSWRDSSSSTPP